MGNGESEPIGTLHAIHLFVLTKLPVAKTNRPFCDDSHPLTSPADLGTPPGRTCPHSRLLTHSQRPATLTSSPARLVVDAPRQGLRFAQPGRCVWYNPANVIPIPMRHSDFPRMIPDETGLVPDVLE